MKIGIVISVYDKLYEVQKQVEIIRSWKGEYEIGVSCNNPDLWKKLEKLDIDFLVKPRHIPILDEGFANRKTPWATKDEVKKHYSIRLRAAECVRSGCWHATEHTNSDYIIHVHADFWMLDENKVVGLIDEMKKRGKVLAVRGKGLELTFHPFRNCNAFGMIDDNFFIFNRKWFKQQRVWDYLPESMLYHKYSVHAILGLVFGVKVGLHNMWMFRKLQDCTDLFGNKSSSLNPVQVDAKYGFVHINSAFLDEGEGRAMQEYALYITGYNESYDLTDFANVLRAVDDVEKKNKKLELKCKLALMPKHVRDNLSVKMKERYLNNLTVFSWFKSLYHLVSKHVLDSIYKMPENAAKYYKDNCDIDTLVGEDNWTEGFYD